MTKLNIPSLQHMARNYRENPITIQKLLVRLAKNPPRFNYNPLFSAVRDLLVFNQPYDQVLAGIKRIKRKDVRDNLLSVMPLIRDHFSDVKPDFIQSVAKRYYPIGRGLMVPFDPPLIYGVGGQLYFPWFSFWRSNPLALERLSLFITLVDEVLLQDPDLESVRFDILDFSAPTPKEARKLSVVDARELTRLNECRKAEMLEIFAEGYINASKELFTMKGAETEKNTMYPEQFNDPNQLKLL